MPVLPPINPLTNLITAFKSRVDVLPPIKLPSRLLIEPISKLPPLAFVNWLIKLLISSLEAFEPVNWLIKSVRELEFKLLPESRLFKRESREGVEGVEPVIEPLMPERLPPNKPLSKLVFYVSVVNTGLSLVLIELRILKAIIVLRIFILLCLLCVLDKPLNSYSIYIQV